MVCGSGYSANSPCASLGLRARLRCELDEKGEVRPQDRRSPNLDCVGQHPRWRLDMATTPRPSPNHPLPLLPGCAGRARLSLPRLRLQGRDGARHAQRRHAWRSIVSGPTRHDGPGRARTQPDDAAAGRRGDDGRLHLSRRRRQALRGRRGGGRGDPRDQLRTKDVPYGRTYSAVDPEGHPWHFTTPPKAD